MNGTYYISAEHMTVGYDGKPLIEDIRIGVRRGEILTLIGPNGSGKSTILKSMIRELKLIAGTVVLDGRDMAKLREREIAKQEARIAELDALSEEYGSDYQKLMELAAEREELEAALLELYERWEELNA